MLNTLLIIIIVVHGLIHLLGFFKEWKIMAVKEMTGETAIPLSAQTAKIFGMLWLIACIIFIISAAIVWKNFGWWWMMAAAGIIISQFLITVYWKDAKAGTAANLIILIFVCLAFAYWSFDRQIDNLAKNTIAKTNSSERTVITAEMLDDLPAPVKKYLTNTSIIGRTIPKVVRLKQNIKFKMAPNAKWTPLTGEEYYTINPPALVWKAESPVNSPFPLMIVRDLYADNKGNILGKLLSLISVAKASGPEIDQGAMMRYLNEIMWFPEAYLSDYITWTALDDSSAQVTFTFLDKSVSAVMYFDADGKIVNFIADRYRMIDGGCEMAVWATPITEYREMNGLQLPVSGQGVWKLEDSDFAYIDVTVTEIEYNNNEVY